VTQWGAQKKGRSRGGVGGGVKKGGAEELVKGDGRNLGVINKKKRRNQKKRNHQLKNFQATRGPKKFHRGGKGFLIR